MKRENKLKKRAGLGFGKTIKRVEVLSELHPKPQVIMDIQDAITKCSSAHCEFNYIDGHGELRQRVFREMRFGKAALEDPFTAQTTVIPVKIHYANGDWEYGLKCFDEVCKRGKNVLLSFYRKVGLLDEVKGRIKNDIQLVGAEYRIPAWVLDILPRWNDKIAQKVEERDNEWLQKHTTYSLEDWGLVGDTYGTSYISSEVNVKDIIIDGKRERFAPVGYDYTKSVQNYPMMTTWKDDYCVDERARIVYLNEQPILSEFYYAYVKSFYAKTRKRGKVYTLIPISSLLNIVARPYSKNKEETELWNNLDSTVKGIF